MTSLQHDPCVALWRWECQRQDALVGRHATEAVLGCWTGLLQLMKHRKPRPLLAVRFQHAAPDSPDLLRQYEEYFRCPVLFSQPASELVLSSESLMLANPGLQDA